MVFVGEFSVYALFAYFIFGALSAASLYEASKKAPEENMFTTKTGIIILTAICFPVGLFTLWKKEKNLKKTGIVAAIACCFIGLGFFNARTASINYTGTAEQAQRAVNPPIKSTSLATETETLPETTTAKTTTTKKATTSRTTSGATTTKATTTKATTTQPPTEPPTQAPTQPPVIVRDYVLNNNSMKFHYPNCSSVDDILPENRQDVTATRDEVISWGYDSCGRCHP